MSDPAPLAEPRYARLDFLAGQRSYTPREYLRELFDVLAKGARASWDMPLDDKMRLLMLRRGVHKPVRELRDACLFALLVEQVLDMKERERDVRIRLVPAKDEADSADVYALWEDSVGPRFAPLQMKELPPRQVNPTASLNDLLAKLRKYPPSETSPAVAVYLNRRVRLAEVVVPGGLHVSSLWLFGAATPDATRWGLFGDLLEQAPHYRNLPLAL